MGGTGWVAVGRPAAVGEGAIVGARDATFAALPAQAVTISNMAGKAQRSTRGFHVGDIQRYERSATITHNSA